MAPSSLATRWRGPQPVRAQADPDASKAEKNACETKGLYRTFEEVQESLGMPGEASVSRPSRLSVREAGLAQASQSSAGIWLTDDRASRVISDESIDDLNRSRVTIGHRSGDQHRKDRASRARLQGRQVSGRKPSKII